MNEEVHDLHDRPWVMNEAVARYWQEHYTQQGLCSLCGNSGVLDTRGAKSAIGVRCGALHFCICPNGQRFRALKLIPEAVKAGWDMA